ncbi:hypothetical protein [Nocardia iowensis]|uniref:Uncharacterized protein n=1 Tax=Nocardia iowensis TaxID=204891 RepID=A0ABX8RWM0_NOCIO|nr:hypothetical protein [Nocardia iowensis]QXN93372.1 hypothetical protein KV110_09930 [Nocardia iowensis]
MTRDLPFDDDATEAAERAGDTAYRVATGVARVARAGAYVTGGALVAAYDGGGTPEHPGSSRLDSWNAGWANTSDPDSDTPSPVITFPDPVVEPAPVNSPHSANSPVAHGNSGFNLPGTGGGANLPLPSLGDEYNGTDAGFPLPGSDSGQHGMELPSLPGGGTGQQGMQLPGLSGAPSGIGATPESSGLPLPGTPNHAPSNGLDLPGGNGFGLPGHGLGQAGHGFGLPGANGFVAPGLPGSNPAAAASPSAGGPFDGVGDGGDPLGIFVGTQWSVDFGVGPHGIYFNSEMKVDLGAGHVGDQLDQFTDWLGSGLHVPDGSGRSVTDPTVTSHGTPGVVGGLTTPGSSTHQSNQSGHSSHSTVPTATTQPVPQPLAAPAPIMSTAPAPVAAAAAAPVVAVAPVASAPQPVVATPLQTTIQPDAATTPIANVIGAPEGPSVLTVPAAATPALFDQARPTPVVKPTPAIEPHSSEVTITTPNTPTTITKTVPVPVVPSDVTAPSVPKTPDLGTKIPGVPTTPHGGISTGPDVPTTKTPGATGTHPTQVPTTDPDGDVTTPGTGTGNGGATGGVTTQPTVPTREVPTVTQPEPTVSVPTHDVPTAVPTHNAPVPTHDLPPTFHAPSPTQAPVPTYKPPVMDPKPHAIADPINSTHMVAATAQPVTDYTAYTDHSTLAAASGSGLSGGLMPESMMSETHHATPGGWDIPLV